MRKIWYLKQEKGQKTKTAKMFLYEKDGHVEGRMDLSAFCDHNNREEKTLLLHIKDASGKDVGKINLEAENLLYESFFQGKGKLKEELAGKLKKLKGEAFLSVTLGKERYLSEGWKEGEAGTERATEKEKSAEVKETGTKGENVKTENTKGKMRGSGAKETEEEKRNEKTEKGEKEKTRIEATGEKAGIKEKRAGAGALKEELESEELLQEESAGKRIVQLSVLEDELFFRSYVHNSFLLHGYYNYGHVVIDESGEEPRLGVPGNYYEREQMVAEMFGFPVFEAAREGEKTLNGTFGYFYTKG